MNKHPTFLGLLGILPNQLRTLLKESGHEHREEALLDISKTLFFAGFRVWCKRQQLAKRYWNAVGQIQKIGVKSQKGDERETWTKNFLNQNVKIPFTIFLDIQICQINVLLNVLVEISLK